MTSFLDKLNLRPQERRLVVIVGIVVFVVLNLWLVRPYFGELARIQQRKADAQKNLKRYQEELKKEPEYRRELNRLQALGNYVATDQQGLELMREVQSQAAMHGVNVQRWDPMRTSTPRTNSFFEEATLTITVNTGEKELVDFLWSLSSTGSLTRVRTLTLQRDPSQMRLAGTITFVKSFQRKPQTKPAATTSPATVAAATPGAKSTPAGVKPGAVKPATNAPASKAAAVKPGGPVKPGSSTNAPPAVAKGKGAEPASTNANWFKRMISKVF